MEYKDRVKEYCKTVNEQVRWNKAHENITRELEDHIDDQMEVFLTVGMDKSEAERAAVREMGDPVLVGSSLDRVHRPKVQGAMIGLVIMLAMIGFGIRYAIGADYINNMFFVSQFITLLGGIVLMIALYSLDFSIIGKFPFLIFGGSVLFSLGAVFFADGIAGGSFLMLGGVHINLGYMSLVFPVIITALIYGLRNMGYKGIVLAWAGIGFYTLLLFYVPLLTGAVHVLLIGLIVLLVAVYKGWFGVNRLRGMMISLSPIVVMGIVSLYAFLNNEHIRERATLVFMPWKIDSSSVYADTIVNQMMVEFISKANWIGIGDSMDIELTKHISVGDVWTDAIVAYGIYKFGWIPFVLVIGLLILFLIKGIKSCSVQKSMLGLLVSLSIVLSLGFQAWGYMLFNFGVYNVWPLSLPFISYANTALMINLGFTGIMLSVFRNGDEVRDWKFVRGRVKV